MKTVIVFGYYGNGNIGDEAILSQLIKRIRNEFPLSRIVIASNDPVETARLHAEDSIGLSWFQRPKLIYFIIKERPIIVIGGGGILYGNSVRFYSLLALISKVLGLELRIVGVSVGPRLNYDIIGFYNRTARFTGINRILIKLLFEIAKNASVRDKLSKEILANSGVERDVIIENDLALSLDSISENYASELLYNHIPADSPRPYIGLNLRYIRHDETRNRIISEISKVINYASKKNLSVIFLPMGNKYDSSLINYDAIMFDLIKQKSGSADNLYLLRGKYHPSEMLGIFGLMDIIIGMRLHSIIFAYSKKVPSYAIAYESKVVEFCQSNKIPYSDIYNIDGTRILDFIDEELKRKVSKNDGKRLD
jgi:polysaccharide pyruvyl transferase WcaK-like protein